MKPSELLFQVEKPAEQWICPICDSVFTVTVHSGETRAGGLMAAPLGPAHKHAVRIIFTR